MESGVLATGTENQSTSWDGISGSFDDGVWLAAWHRFLWKLDEQPGYFLVFFGYSTRDQPSNEELDFINLPGQGITSRERQRRRSASGMDMGGGPGVCPEDRAPTSEVAFLPP